jgi:hypothetical protein
MAHELLQFMDEALVDENLLNEFTTKFSDLYDAQGNPKFPDSDEQLSNWFDDKGYNISKGQCKKLGPATAKASGKVMPQY